MSSRRRQTVRAAGNCSNRPTEAELKVLRLLGGDLSTREIGEKLYLSASTVHSHKHALYRKLGVHSRRGRSRGRKPSVCCSDRNHLVERPGSGLARGELRDCLRHGCPGVSADRRGGR